MNEFDDLETALHRYRPEGPPADLRRRALFPVSKRRALAAWLPAAAALAIAVLLYGMASRAYDRVADEVTSERRADRNARIDALAPLFGTGVDARAAAEIVVDDDARRAAQVSSAQTESGVR